MAFPKQPSHQAVMIDNATLRGALIALGLLDSRHTEPNEPIKVFDVHVASAEVLIESMLLYDHIYVPKVHENYPKTVERIQSIIGGELIRELPLELSEVSAIEHFAEQDFAAWPLGDDHLRQRLQEFAGVQPSTLSWQGKKSGWDEVLLGSYVKSHAALYTWHEYTSTVSDYAVNQLDAVLLKGQEQPLEKLFAAPYLHGKTLDLKLLDAASLWLTYRTCIYDCLSWVAGIPYVPHPQRAALWKAVNLRRSQPAIFAQVPFDVLLDARLSVAEQVKQAVGLQLYDLEIPPMFTYILSKSRSASEVLDTVMKVRQQRGVKALRKVLGELSANLYEEGSVTKLLDLKKQFEEIKQELNAQFQEPTLPKITPSFQLAGVLGVQFDLPLPPPLVQLGSRLRTLNKPHIAVLRDIFKVTMNIWQLSHLYDRLYQGRQILVEKSITRPAKALQGKPHLISERTYHDTRVKSTFPTSIEDPLFTTPLQCREKLTESLQNTPRLLHQLVLIDIDGLNLYNTRGHRLGDKILDAVGIRIRKADVNLISKVAGDTFIVVKIGEPSTTWLDNLKEEFSHLPVDDWLLESWFKEGLKSRPIQPIKPISTSTGIAISPLDGSSADTLFKVAYERLALGKQHKGEITLVGDGAQQLGEKHFPVGNSFNVESPEPDQSAKDSSLLERVANLKPRSLYSALEQAGAHFKSKQYQQAIELYTLAIALYSSNADIHATYNNRGCAYIRNRNYQRAIVDFTQAISLDPINAQTFANRGVAYLSIRDVRRAQANFQRSIELDPKQINAAWMSEWIDMGKEPLTIVTAVLLERISALNPKKYIALVCQAVALSLRGKPEVGLEKLEEAILSNAEDWDAFFWKGILTAYANPKKSSEVAKAIEQALTLGMPPILLTPIYWLQVDRPDCFEQCRVYLARYLGDKVQKEGTP